MKTESHFPHKSENIINQQLLSLVAKRTHNGVIITDTAGIVQWVNEAFSQLTGLSEIDVIGKSIENSLPGIHNVPNCLAEVKSSFQDSNPCIIEIPHHDNLGNHFWFSLEFQPVLNESGDLQNFIVIQSNISKLKEREQDVEVAIKETNKTNTELEQRVTELSFLNKISQTLTGIQDLQKALEIVAKEMVDLFQARSSGIAIFNEDRSELIVTAEFIQDPNEPSGIGIALPHKHPTISRVVHDGQPVNVDNAQTHPLYADMRDMMVARNTHAIMAVPLRAKDRIIGSIGIDRTTPELPFTENEVKLAETIAGQLAGTIEIARLFDESQKSRKSAELANKAKSVFLANMSHEIRTPLNAVVGLTSLMLDTPLNAEQHDFIETIRRSSDGLLNIINDILDFSKIEAGKLDLEHNPLNLHDCVSEALDLVSSPASEKGLELAFLIDDKVPQFISGDVTRLRQILVNLLNNAVKFTSEGEVFLSVTLFSTHDNLIKLRFSILDTGIGIPPERMDRLFRSFSQVDSSTTRQYGGTGLGLVISTRLAEAMGGRMWVESEPGKGSIFSFTILAEAIEDERLTAVTDLESQMLTSGKHVLVVDDNDVNRLIMKHLLYPWKAKSTIVSSGEEALNLLRDGDRFDVGILDMQMPRMDGVMLAKAIKALEGTRPFPLLLLTSVGQMPDGPDKDLFASVVTKPVKPNNLLLSLLKTLSQSQPQPSSPESKATISSPPIETSLNILLAEDNKINQKVALRMLKRMGYQADVAETGLEVIEAVQQNHYDIILMDVQMPEMDGREATMYIRKKLQMTQQPYIIALTANALKGDRESYLEAGMNDYLSKPVRTEQIATAFSKYESTILKAGE